MLLMFRSTVHSLTKLAGLVIKTLSKPLSKRIQHQLSRSPTGERVLVHIGRSFHNITSRMTIWGAGYKVRSITPISDTKAAKEGAELVGESVVFVVSGGWLWYEYQNATRRARAKEAASRARAKAERDELRTRLHAVDVRLLALETALERQWGITYRAPPEKRRVPIAAPLSPEDDDDDDEEAKDAVVTRKDPVVMQRRQQQEEDETATSRSNHNAWWRRIWPF